MTTDYDQFYKDNPHGLGEPTKEFVSFFKNWPAGASDVLDVGYGQGRDALFIARLGHRVTAIDQSPTGIGDLLRDAESEGLQITGIVADIRDHSWSGKFDVIVLDRTLHMLSTLERARVLRKLLTMTRKQSHIVIADAKSNIPAFRTIFEESQYSWTPTLARRGFLFMVR